MISPHNPPSPLILASASKQRRMLLETLGIPFEVIASNIDEKAITAASPQERVMAVATAKGVHVAAKRPEAVIIAADTFCILDGVTFEKPNTKDEAIAMLTTFSGREIMDCTGLYYRDPNKHIELVEIHVCLSTMRPLTMREITRYVESNPVLGWAGAFSPAYQEGMALFGQVRGSLTAFTHGLPIDRVAELLKSSELLY